MMNFNQDELETILRSLIGEQLEDSRNPIEALDTLAQARGTLDDLIELHARNAKRNGEPWSAIGGALGITRQAAQQRYGTED